LFRYSIYCTEYGYPITDPYCEDRTFETAIEVCVAMAKATKCRWYVFDYRKGTDVYVYLGDKI